MNEVERLCELYTPKSDMEKELIKHLLNIFGYQYTEHYILNIKNKGDLNEKQN